MTTRIVATKEFFFTVKRPAYLIMTFGMPVIMLIYVGIIAAIAAVTAAPAASARHGKAFGVVDHSGLIEPVVTAVRAADAARAAASAPTATRPEDFESFVREVNAEFEAQDLAEMAANLRTYPDVASACDAIRRGEIEDFVFVPADYRGEGRLSHYTRQWRLIASSARPPQIAELLSRGMLLTAGFSDDDVRRLNGRPRVRSYEPDASGDFVEINPLQRGLAIGVPVGIAMILLISLVINAGLMVQAIGEEKENKVMELLLSSVRAEQLLMGKVLGLGAAAMLQIGVWLSMAGIFPLLLMLALRQQTDFALNVPQLVCGAVFFALGFLFYGALLVGFGSLGTNMQQSQQFSILVILMPLVPLFASIALLDSPNGTFSRVFSWIPPFTAPAMLFRMAGGALPWWDIGGAMAILVLSAWLAVRISARLFRLGTLLQGKAPSPMLVLRAIVRPD